MKLHPFYIAVSIAGVLIGLIQAIQLQVLIERLPK